MQVRNSGRMITWFTVEAMSSGCHIYKDAWESSFGEQLFGEIEENNRYDSYVVVVVKIEIVIGNIIQNMALNSTTCFCAGVDLLYVVKLMVKDTTLVIHNKEDWRFPAMVLQRNFDNCM